MTLSGSNVELAHDLILPQPQHAHWTTRSPEVSRRFCAGNTLPSESPSSALEKPCAPRKTTNAHRCRSRSPEPAASENQRRRKATVRRFPSRPWHAPSARPLRPSRPGRRVRRARFCTGTARRPALQHNPMRFANPGARYRRTRLSSTPPRKSTSRAETRTGTANARSDKQPAERYAWSRGPAVRRCEQIKPARLKCA